MPVPETTTQDSSTDLDIDQKFVNVPDSVGMICKTKIGERFATILLTRHLYLGDDNKSSLHFPTSPFA